MSFIGSSPRLVWHRVVSFSKNADWPMVQGVLFILLMVGLIVAIYIRHTTRDRLLSRNSEEHFTARYLPVTYLSFKTGNLKDMLLSPSQYVVFGMLNNEALKRKHGMCTDEPSWSHFCLLAAAEVYQRVSNGRGQFRRSSSPEDSINSIIESSIQDLAVPYMQYLFRSKTNISNWKINASIASSDTATRGVRDLNPINDITLRNIAVVNI